MLGGLAEFERDLIRTRTAEDRSWAQKRGQDMGRPRVDHRAEGRGPPEDVAGRDACRTCPQLPRGKEHDFTTVTDTMTIEDRPAAEPEIIRWPTLGDRLFSSTHWAFDAHVAKGTGERFYRMAQGYKRAGDLLAKHTDDNASDRDNLVYPTIFCYRQYIELALKEFIEDYGHKVGILPDRKNHTLPTLWTCFTRILNYYGHNDSNSPEIAVVGDHIAEFASIDEHSTTFRYPMQQSGQSFEIKKEQFDLVQLRHVMESIYTFFDCIATYLHSLELQEDYTAQARSFPLG